VGYDWLVTLALSLHFGYLAYLVLGGFLAWRWPKAILAHLVACVWGGLIVAGLANCPLTWVEDRARVLAGQTPLTQGFVDRYLDGVIYPEQYVNVARLLVAAVVALSWSGAYWNWRRRGPHGSDRGADTGVKSGGDGERAVTV
jgi:hypothetical protein